MIAKWMRKRRNKAAAALAAALVVSCLVNTGARGTAPEKELRWRNNIVLAKEKKRNRMLLRCMHGGELYTLDFLSVKEKREK